MNKHNPFQEVKSDSRQTEDKYNISKQEYIKQLTYKVREQAVRLQKMQEYRILLENRIREFCPSHPFPIKQEHLGTKLESFTTEECDFLSKPKQVKNQNSKNKNVRQKEIKGKVRNRSQDFMTQNLFQEMPDQKDREIKEQTELIRQLEEKNKILIQQIQLERNQNDQLKQIINQFKKEEKAQSSNNSTNCNNNQRMSLQSTLREKQNSILTVSQYSTQNSVDLNFNFNLAKNQFPDQEQIQSYKREKILEYYINLYGSYCDALKDKVNIEQSMRSEVLMNESYRNSIEIIKQQQKQQIKQLEKEFKEQNNEILQQISEHNQQIEDYETEIQNMKNQIQIQQQEFEEALNEKEKKIQKQEQNIQSLKQILDQKETIISANKINLSQINEKQQTKMSEFQSLIQQHEEIKLKLEQDVEKLQNEKESINTDRNNLSQILQLTKQDLKNYIQQYDDINEQNQQNKKQIQKLEEQIASLEAKIKELQNQKEIVETQFRNLQAEVQKQIKNTVNKQCSQF